MAHAAIWPDETDELLTTSWPFSARLGYRCCPWSLGRRWYLWWTSQRECLIPRSLDAGSFVALPSVSPPSPSAWLSSEASHGGKFLATRLHSCSVLWQVGSAMQCRCALSDSSVLPNQLPGRLTVSTATASTSLRAGEAFEHTKGPRRQQVCSRLTRRHRCRPPLLGSRSLSTRLSS